MMGLKRVLFLLLACSGCASAAIAPPPPRHLTAQVGFDQKLGTQLPLDVKFIDQSGEVARLGHWMAKRPTLLMLGYFRCPNLCDVAEQGMAHAVALSGLQPGKDVSVLFVSIDTRDTPKQAADKQRMVAHMQKGAHVAAWHFLVGSPASIRALAQAVGYRYVYDARLDQFAHPAGLVITTAEGKVNQYLMGVNYVPKTLHLAVVGASHHSLGNIVDQLVLLCCGYDPATGRYTVTIDRIMQGLGFGFVAILLLLFMLLRKKRAGASP